MKGAVRYAKRKSGIDARPFVDCWLGKNVPRVLRFRKGGRSEGKRHAASFRPDAGGRTWWKEQWAIFDSSFLAASQSNHSVQAPSRCEGENHSVCWLCRCTAGAFLIRT